MIADKKVMQNLRWVYLQHLA